MLRTIEFNKIDENFVLEYEIKVINNLNQEVISSEIIKNESVGPTLHSKELPYNVNNIYYVDDYIYYSDFYSIEVYVDDKIINNINIEYNSLTKSFFLKNIENLNENSKIVVKFYKNLITTQVEIPANCKVVVIPILYKKHYVGNHNVLY